jgi:tetratricopeptide (TPR) repeat protein
VFQVKSSAGPEHESGYYTKACYYALQGEREPAIDDLQQAMKYNPDKHHRKSIRLKGYD